MAIPIGAAGVYAAIARLTANPAQAAAAPADPKSAASLPCSRRRSAWSTSSAKNPTRRPAPWSTASNVVDVITAVSATKVAIDAVVAVRDKIIVAYEDIMKMPIG